MECVKFQGNFAERKPRKVAEAGSQSDPQEAKLDGIVHLLGNSSGIAPATYDRAGPASKPTMWYWLDGSMMITKATKPGAGVVLLSRIVD